MGVYLPSHTASQRYARLLASQHPRHVPLPHQHSSFRSVILVKDLIRILQNSIHHPNLPPGIRDIRPGGGAHERGAKHDSQVLRAHPVGRRVVYDAVQVERQGAQRGVVWVREAVDDGVEGVAADDVVFVFCAPGKYGEIRRRSDGREI